MNICVTNNNFFKLNQTDELHNLKKFDTFNNCVVILLLELILRKEGVLV